MEEAVCEWLQMQEPHFYYDRIFKCLPRCKKCISVLRDYILQMRIFCSSSIGCATLMGFGLLNYR